MFTVAVVAVAMAYLGTGSTKLGCGSARVLLTFHVVDDEDESPVPYAAVGLYRDWTAPATASTTTVTEGSGQVGWQTGATWYSGPFFRQYRCLYYGDGLRITADGYEPVEALLKQYTSDLAYHNTSAPPPILVRLKRKSRNG